MRARPEPCATARGVGCVLGQMRCQAQCRRMRSIGGRARRRRGSAEGCRRAHWCASRAASTRCRVAELGSSSRRTWPRPSLSALRPRDIRGLQAELLTSKSAKTEKPLSVKTVKNVISGSLRAMITQAVADEEITVDLFAGVTWPKWTPPEPDPFSDDHRDAVLQWFTEASFGFPASPALPSAAGFGTRHSTPTSTRSFGTSFVRPRRRGCGRETSTSTKSPPSVAARGIPGVERRVALHRKVKSWSCWKFERRSHPRSCLVTA